MIDSEVTCVRGTSRACDDFGIGHLTAVHELGETEREVERLPRVQPRVAERLVAIVELRLVERVRAAEALGDVLARVLEVHAARPNAFLAARGEETLELRHD